VELVLILVGVGVTAGLFKWWFNPQRIMKKQLRSASTKTIASMGEGEIARMIGHARVHHTALEAPLTGRACFYYIVRVERENGDDGWSEVVREEQGVPFVLDDGTGRALVDATRAELALEFDRRDRIGMWQQPDARQSAFLSRYSRLHAAHTYRFREAAIEVDERIAVLGGGTRELDPEGSPTGYRDQAATLLRLESPMIISDDPSTTT
jgi:hypothetical protein